MPVEQARTLSADIDAQRAHSHPALNEYIALGVSAQKQSTPPVPR